MKHNIVILFLLILCTSLNAQVRRADKMFDRLAYSKAIPIYLKHIRKNPGDKASMEKLAEAYRKTNNSQEAEKWYGMMVNMPDAVPMDRYYYARALMANGKYDEAKGWLSDYLKEKPGDKVGERLLWSCNHVGEFLKDSTLYTVKITEINSPEADFAPEFYGNKVIYASSRETKGLKHLWTGRTFLDLYEIDYVGGYRLSGEVKRLKGLINTKLHEAVLTFSPDGKTVYFTRNNFSSGKIGRAQDGTILLKIYSAELKGNRWAKVREFPFNSHEYSVGHPALSPDGNRIYFASNMPGGYGETDIWFCERSGDGWGTPQNLGPLINSSEEELFPWIAENGTLFYASEGHHSMGGLDIFEAKPNGPRFLEPVNMGYPINSISDDFHLILNQEKGYGFFSSNRAGGPGDDDIYGFIRKYRLKGIVIDAKTKDPVPYADLILEDVMGNKTTNFSDSLGKFRSGLELNRQYRITAKAENYLMKTISVSTMEVDPTGEQQIIIELEKVEECPVPITLSGTVVRGEEKQPVPGTKVKVVYEEWVTVDENGKFEAQLDPEREYKVVIDDPTMKDKIPVSTINPPEDNVIPMEIMLGNFEKGDTFFIIYYNYDKSDIRYDASLELDRVIEFMDRYPDVKVSLHSHTDARASFGYNVELSKRRATEAFDYIVKKGGIDASRMEYKWYGETMPKNRCKDGVECSEEEHQFNRRTEFVITAK